MPSHLPIYAVTLSEDLDTPQGSFVVLVVLGLHIPDQKRFAQV